MALLNQTEYLSFPFTVKPEHPQTSGRSDHVREQIEQVLFTHPKERVFRPEFGVGVRDLVFEPNNSTLWNITHKQLVSSLAQALQGEVDSKTLSVKLEAQDSKLVILIAYRLAAINKTETQSFTVSGDSDG